MRKKLIVFSSFACFVLGWFVLSNRSEESENWQSAPHLKSYKSSKGPSGFGAGKDSISTTQASVVSLDQVLNKDMVKLARELRVDEDESYRLKELNNFRTPINDIVKRVDPVEYALFLQETMKKLQSCIVEDFCGMEKDSTDSAYFDETNTIAHKTLKRSLEAMDILLGSEDVRERFDKSVLERLLENNNDEIQEKVMSLIRKVSSKKDTYKALIDSQEYFDGYAKAAYFRELSMVAEDEKELQTYDYLLSESLAQDDPHTVISILEKLPGYFVQKERLNEIALNVCRFTQSEAPEHNKIAVEHNIKNLKNKNILSSEFECL